MQSTVTSEQTVPGIVRFACAMIASMLLIPAANGEEPFSLSRCEILPLPDHQASFQVDGVEVTRWHFGAKYPRPFFYPLQGPSGTSLTRMGHPGAANHDHHLSVWFAHHDVDGFSFWADGKGTTIRQKNWYAYEDGNDEMAMACNLGWYDPDGVQRMQQDLVACVIPGENGQYALELQADFRPAAGRDVVQIGQSNFGFLAVRVAKTLSVHFGGGKLTSSEGAVGEPEIFGKPARWIDYSGPIAHGTGSDRAIAVEGITYFDHPSNPRHPTSWHVRSDGWMGASFAMHEDLQISNDQPLRLRYLLQVHSDGYDHTACEAIYQAFADRKAFEIRKGGRPHSQFTVSRIQE